MRPSRPAAVAWRRTILYSPWRVRPLPRGLTNSRGSRRPLAGRAAAAVVDEQSRLEPLADEARLAAAEVGRECPRGGGADGDEPLAAAVAAGPQGAGAEVDVGELE